MEARNAANVEANMVESDLPSYTIASGLPSYEEALEQLKNVKDPTMSKKIGTNDSSPQSMHTTAQMTTLSVVNLTPVIDDKASMKNTSWNTHKIMLL